MDDDFANMSTTQLEALIARAAEWHTKKLAEEKQQDIDLRQRILEAEAALTGLLGPEDAPAGQSSISAMRKYSTADLQKYSGLALRLVLIGMATQTRTMIDLVRAIGQTTK